MLRVARIEPQLSTIPGITATYNRYAYWYVHLHRLLKKARFYHLASVIASIPLLTSIIFRYRDNKFTRNVLAGYRNVLDFHPISCVSENFIPSPSYWLHKQWSIVNDSTEPITITNVPLGIIRLQQLHEIGNITTTLLQTTMNITEAARSDFQGELGQ